MRIFILLAILFLGACSTSPTRSPASDPTVTSEIFVKQVQIKTIKELDPKDCHSSELKNSNWKELLNSASACVSAAKWNQVDLFAKELSERDTSSPWGPYFYALSAENQNQMERAIWMNELALKRAPTTALFYYQKGRLSWKRDSYKESVDSFNRALQLDSNFIDAHLFLGQIHFRDQDYARSARHFQAVLRVRPKDQTALIGLAECHIQLSDAKSALEFLEKGARLYTAESVYLVRQAYVYEYLLNDAQSAVEIYKKLERGSNEGLYSKKVDVNVNQKIRDLEGKLSARSLAGAKQGVEQ